MPPEKDRNVSGLCALVPARRGSKGIPRKNMQMFADKPLVLHSIQAAMRANRLDRVIVSTDDPDIADISDQDGAEVLWREASNSGDEASAFDVIAEAMGKMPELRAIVYLQPTSPLRTHEHIDSAIEKFQGGEYSSLVSVVKVPHNFLPSKQMKVEGQTLVPFVGTEFVTSNRQQTETTYARNGPAILITRRETVEDGSLYGPVVVPFVMDPIYSFDIDSPADFAIAEAVKKCIL